MIPEALEIDVSEMMIGDIFKITDLIAKYPEIDFLDESEVTIASVRPPVVEAEPVEVETEVGEGEPELLTKDKKGEEETEEKKDESS
jgi:hypothetical protein